MGLNSPGGDTLVTVLVRRNGRGIRENDPLSHDCEKLFCCQKLNNNARQWIFPVYEISNQQHTKF